MPSRTYFDANGNQIRRVRTWRKPTGEVWYREWTGDPLAVTTDRAGTPDEEAQIAHGEEDEGADRLRKRLRRSVEELLATAGNANETVTVLVAAGIVPPKVAKAAGWVLPVQ